MKAFISEAANDHVNLPFELDAQHSGSNKASQSPERLDRVKEYAGLPYFVDHQCGSTSPSDCFLNRFRRQHFRIICRLSLEDTIGDGQQLAG